MTVYTTQIYLYINISNLVYSHDGSLVPVWRNNGWWMHYVELGWGGKILVLDYDELFLFVLPASQPANFCSMEKRIEHENENGIE